MHAMSPSRALFIRFDAMTPIARAFPFLYRKPASSSRSKIAASVGRLMPR
jgi:hypothetical protein